MLCLMSANVQFSVSEIRFFKDSKKDYEKVFRTYRVCCGTMVM
jgi:hypothetical protein